MTVFAAWIVYALVVSAFLGLAALWAEQSLRSVGRSGRWVWLVAMGLSVVVPLWAWLRPMVWTSAGTTPAAGFIPLAPIVVGPPAGDAGGMSLDVLVAMGWAVLTSVVVFRLMLAYVRLRAMRRDWRRTVIYGETVYVTRDLGPAVLGLRRGSILMPAWALELESRIQHLMLMHEREHLRAGDVRVAAFGQLLVLVQPWNLPLLWQWRRLREAVEVDCDARVLRRDPDARAYGALLLEVGRRRAMPQFALGFAEPRTFLERRIDLLTRARRSGRHALGMGGLALLAAAVAVCTRDPLAVGQASLAIEDVLAQQTRAAFVDGPVFTPFTVAPRLTNPEEVARALERAYPPLLRDAGISGEIMMWFYVDETGQVLRSIIKDNSGYPALDEAAVRVAGIMRFKPAFNRDDQVAVWVQIPIRFATSENARNARNTTVRSRQRGGTETSPASSSTPRTASVREKIEELEQEIAATAPGPIESKSIEGRLRELMVGLQRRTLAVSVAPANEKSLGVEETTRENTSRMRTATTRGTAAGDPEFTPFTEAPRLLNEPEIARELQRNYPPLLRDAGIVGQVVLWFQIDASGRVVRTLLQRSSSHPSLDDAAIRVAESMRFAPAKNRDEPVGAWVQIPIRFSTK
ncbi:MAG: M56 family metallopeptidase [Longimicrobiales bacterium]